MLTPSPVCGSRSLTLLAKKGDGICRQRWCWITVGAGDKAPIGGEQAECDWSGSGEALFCFVCSCLLFRIKGAIPAPHAEQNLAFRLSGSSSTWSFWGRKQQKHKKRECDEVPPPLPVSRRIITDSFCVPIPLRCCRSG